ncbi:MAG: adenylate/guanylate cyclase domain-containing protein [Thermomicrobiales bacterium]
MVELPSGTVTFLFTDIEGSTQRWQQQPMAMGPALARHDRLVREAIEAHSGAVFKMVGDAFCAAFSDPTAALSAALTAQRSLYGEPWGATGPLRVRMALHTGRAEVQDGDYVGAPLNRVARLLSAGHGGQILLSGATAELVADHLPAEIHLRDLGTHQLKDLYRPERIFQLVTPDLPSDFSSISTAAHLPPYPEEVERLDAVTSPSASAAPARSRRASLVPVAAALVILLLALGGAYLLASGDDSPNATPTLIPPTTVAVLPTSELAANPFAAEVGLWGRLDSPPPTPALVVLGEFAFDPGWKGDSQTLPGPMFIYVWPQPKPPTIWLGGTANLMRASDPGTPRPEEAIASGSYIDLHVGDYLTVPADTPFRFETDPYQPAALIALIIFPPGPLPPAPEVLHWGWSSWGTVERWPSGPFEVRFDSTELAPGESKRLTALESPQLVATDNYLGPPLQLMLTSGQGEVRIGASFESGQSVEGGPGESKTSPVATPHGAWYQLSRHPISPNVEATIGGSFQQESAFLDPGSVGTLRNPTEASDPVGIVVVSFGPANQAD